MDWVHKKTIYDGEKFEIDGINIWDFMWESTHEKIELKDPLYNQDFIFEVFKIQKDNYEILFAAGEFSNCVWGIYQKENIVQEDSTSRKWKISNLIKCFTNNKSV